MAVVGRRKFIRGAAALSIAARRISAKVVDNGDLLLVGTQTGRTSKGIYGYRFDAATGGLTQTGLLAETQNPSFLAMSPDGKVVFAVNEIEEYQGSKSGSVRSFALERRTGKLTAKNVVASQGAGPCHVAVDKSGRCVLVANYSGGSVASCPVTAGGMLGEAASFFQFSGSGPDKERQERPHAHRVTVSPDNRFVMVNDLGLDVIHIYKLDAHSAKLTPHEPAVWKATPGSGPRALQFHPNGRWAYCVTEMKSTVNVLHWNARTGSLQTVQEMKLVPPEYSGETGGADIVLDKAGHFAYVANRIDDFLASFSVSPVDGTLTLIERTSCGGKIPRHLALDKTERWLLVANEQTDGIAVFARDARTGRLSAEGKSFPLSRPQCLLFV